MELNMYDPRDLIDENEEIEENENEAKESIAETTEKEIVKYEKFSKGYQEWRSAQIFDTPNATSYLAEKFWRDHTESWPILSKIAQKFCSMNSSSSQVERLFGEMAYDLDSGRARQKAAHTAIVNQRKNSRKFQNEMKIIQEKENLKKKFGVRFAFASHFFSKKISLSLRFRNRLLVEIWIPVWRLWTYQFLHSGLEHIVGNCIVLGALGIVLELIHGPVRVGAIYTLGVVTGGILALVVTPCQSLVGASGGCYALMAAFIANGIMNMDVMDTIVKLLHFLPVSIFLLVDVGYTFYMENTNSGYRVSWAAHLGGVVAGLLAGICILKNFEKSSNEKILKWASIVGFSILFLAIAVYLFVIGSNNPCGIGTKNYEFHRDGGLFSDFNR
ncbi:unnamed protein product [Oikopleura dioica]|uniref:rhomboid protease n=2 Tax=Oikopleura dioica TaxID=34765 RepID=E4XY96_OIKDI|nr:unnamed protein product [Oikopleura dioica]